MEKYKYCNIGPASSPREGGREGGKEGSCYSDIINVTGRRDGTRAGDRLLNAGMHKNFTD